MMDKKEDIPIGIPNEIKILNNQYYRLDFFEPRIKTISVIIIIIGGITSSFISVISGVMTNSVAGLVVMLWVFFIGIVIIIIGFFTQLISKRYIYRHQNYLYPLSHYIPLKTIDYEKRFEGIKYIIIGILISVIPLLISINFFKWGFSIMTDLLLLTVIIICTLPIYCGMFIVSFPYSLYYYPPELYSEEKKKRNHFFSKKIKKKNNSNGEYDNVARYLKWKKVRVVILIVFLLIIPYFYYYIYSINEDYNPYKNNKFFKLELETGSGRSPSLSPDGNQVVYFSSSKNDHEIPAIWMIDINGSNSYMLYEDKTIETWEESPKFSFDNNKIIFTTSYWGNKNHSIDILIKNGTKWEDNAIHDRVYISNWELNEMPPDEGKPENPSFSPDGKIIYEVYGGIDSGSIWLINENRTDNKKILSSDEGLHNPSFSCDGKKIVYMKYIGNHNEGLWTTDDFGNYKKRILTSDWKPENPSFLPDGRILFESPKISLYSNEYTGLNTWIMDDNGENKILIAHSLSGKGINPSVGKNGSIVLYNSYNYFSYIEDPTGKWKDRDGDGVWDGIDGAPNNPYFGYKVGYWPQVCNQFIFPIIILNSVIFYRFNKIKSYNNIIHSPTSLSFSHIP